jgi:hypothetical protein
MYTDTTAGGHIEHLRPLDGGGLELARGGSSHGDNTIGVGGDDTVGVGLGNLVLG